LPNACNFSISKKFIFWYWFRRVNRIFIYFFCVWAPRQYPLKFPFTIKMAWEVHTQTPWSPLSCICVWGVWCRRN
jgi:hypothetical protein